MPYNRPYPGGFVDFPSTSTPIDASALNTMDVGIKTANDQFQTVTTAQRATLTPSVGQAVWDSDLKQVMVYMNASGGNAWQPVGNRIVCASTTRPSSPFEGQEIYETDTQKTLVYSGSAWVETNDLDYSPSATVCTSSTRPATGLFEGQRIYETDTNREFTYSGSGWVQTNQWSTTSGVTSVNNLIVPPAARAVRTAAQTIANVTNTAVAFTASATYDTDGMFSAGSNTILTINTTGLYLVHAFVNWTLYAPGQRYLTVQVGTTNTTVSLILPGNASYTIDHIATGILSLTAGDTIRMMAFHNSGGNLDISSGNLSAAWIGRLS